MFMKQRQNYFSFPNNWSLAKTMWFEVWVAHSKIKPFINPIFCHLKLATISKLKYSEVAPCSTLCLGGNRWHGASDLGVGGVRGLPWWHHNKAVWHPAQLLALDTLCFHVSEDFERLRICVQLCDLAANDSKFLNNNNEKKYHRRPGCTLAREMSLPFQNNGSLWAPLAHQHVFFNSQGQSEN